MRFVAASLVLVAHATLYYHERVSSQMPVWAFGGVGVPIFFVISGIVMVLSAQSLNNDASGARTFVLRRIIRIVPLWWLALSVKVAISVARPELVNHNHFQVESAIKSYLFIPYFTEQHVVPLHSVGWTLLHECFFYAVFSLAMLCGKSPARWASASIVGLCLAGKLIEIDNPFWSVASSLHNLQFVLGMAIASFLLHTNVHRGWRLAAAALLVLAALALQATAALTGLHFTYSVLLVLASGTLVLVNWAVPAPLATLARLGDSSYSLYLFHPFIAPAAILALHRFIPDLHGIANIALAILVTTLGAHALHLWVEAPLVRYARQLLMGKGLAPGGASAVSGQTPRKRV